MSARDVVITGVGLVTSLGEGGAATRDALLAGAAPVLDADALAPALIHPTPALDYDRQIPKKGDQRQMEPWQRLGVYAAGLALSDAGIAGAPEFLGRTHMIVAAGGGERDIAVDEAIMAGLPGAADPGRFLNERLTNDLRPTLFLAQLSNLLAGNISIVHGVTGSSRTFMGEETAGMAALRTMRARIAAGQAEIGLVGGAFAAARRDMELVFAFGRALLTGGHASVWNRAPRGGGFLMGSAGAFIVLEERDHAEARGARMLARLTAVEADRTRREAGEARAKGVELWRRIAPGLGPGPVGILSGASGVEPVTGEERAFLEDVGAERDVAVRATGTALGHSVEPSPIVNVALGALSLEAGRFYPPWDDASGVERPFAGELAQIVTTSFGYWRGEGLCLLARV